MKPVRAGWMIVTIALFVAVGGPAGPVARGARESMVPPGYAETIPVPTVTEHRIPTILEAAQSALEETRKLLPIGRTALSEVAPEYAMAAPPGLSWEEAVERAHRDWGDDPTRQALFLARYIRPGMPGHAVRELNLPVVAPYAYEGPVMVNYGLDVRYEELAGKQVPVSDVMLRIQQDDVARTSTVTSDPSFHLRSRRVNGVEFELLDFLLGRDSAGWFRADPSREALDWYLCRLQRMVPFPQRDGLLALELDHYGRGKVTYWRGGQAVESYRFGSDLQPVAWERYRQGGKGPPQPLLREAYRDGECIQRDWFQQDDEPVSFVVHWSGYW